MALGDGNTWDETTPTDATIAVNMDDYNRDIRRGVRSRMAFEHEWPNSQAAPAEAGKHKFITLQNQAAKPTISGTQLAAVYTKTVGTGLQEAFFENEAGTEVQLTDRSNVTFPSGSVIQTKIGVIKTFVACNGVTPEDDTIPLDSETTQVVQVKITPTNTNNTLIVDAVVAGSKDSTDGTAAICIFNGTTCVSASPHYGLGNHGLTPVVSYIQIGALGTTEITFNLKIGCNFGGAFYVNGQYTGARVYGGVATTSIRVREIKA